MFFKSELFPSNMFPVQVAMFSGSIGVFTPADMLVWRMLDSQLSYSRWIATTVHSLGMSVGLKNSLPLVERLEPMYDWFLNEQCNGAFFSMCLSVVVSMVVSMIGPFDGRFYGPPL